MAGRGPAPQFDDVRLGHAGRQRGEWLELPPATAKAPALPPRGKGRGGWSARTREAWRSWWADPASTQWGPADRDLVLHLADVFELWVRSPRAAMATEIRQLRDSLGLTPKGKQDRRWRLATEAVEAPSNPRRIRAGTASRRFGAAALRVVAPADETNHERTAHDVE